MHPPRFFVTGSTGFIGRRLVGRLVFEFGPGSVTCLAKPPSTLLQTRALNAQRRLGLRMIDTDLLDDPITLDAPPGADVVFHLAANIDTAASDDELRVNHVGTRHLLQWLGAGSDRPRIVYASTVAVHDRTGEPTTPICEKSPLVPQTAYGRTKLLGEAVVQELGAVGLCSWTILRLPTVYGPGQKPDGLFQRFIALTSQRDWLGRINWPGRTSIMHVDDVVDAMIDLGMRPDTAGEVYCLASDESLTVGEIAQRIAHALGRPLVPIDVARPLWQVARAVVWSRTFQALIPPPARVPMWRLNLMLSDAFWFDTTKFRRVYSKRLRSLDEGLADTVAGMEDRRITCFGEEERLPRTSETTRPHPSSTD